MIDRPEGRHANVLGTLANGLAVLEELANGPRSITALADDLGLPRQSAYRLVNTLVQAGWAARIRGTDRYRPTTRVWEVGVRGLHATSVRDVRAQLENHVRALASDYGETVHLTILDGGEVVYIDKVDGTAPIRSYTELGGRAPAYCVATGKALLAFSSPERLARILEGPLERFTATTIAVPAELRAEIARIRRQGFAVNRGEWREGVGGVAVPILHAGQEATAALGFSGPRGRIEERQEELVEALRRTIDATVDDATPGSELAELAGRG